jgi:hypothetical protein
MSFANRTDPVISFFTLQYSASCIFLSINPDSGNFLGSHRRIIKPEINQKLKNSSRDFVFVYKNAFSFGGLCP